MVAPATSAGSVGKIRAVLSPPKPLEVHLPPLEQKASSDDQARRDAATEMGVGPADNTTGKRQAAVSSPETREVDLPVLEQEVSSDDHSRSVCASCCRVSDSDICRSCISRTRRSLLSVTKRFLSQQDTCGPCGYCLLCKEITTGRHTQHEGSIIPLGRYKNQVVAWATGKESWFALFAGVQGDRVRRPLRPFLVCKPAGLRCDACLDIVCPESPYGSLVSFCTIQRWAAGGGGGAAAADLKLSNAMISLSVEDKPDMFCITCAVGFRRSDDSDHKSHDCFTVVTNTGARGPRVVVAAEHQMALVWSSIKKEGDQLMPPLPGVLASGPHEIVIREEPCLRCRCCRVRLTDGGGDTCSLECSNHKPLITPRAPMTPRCLLLKTA